jgi:hypothetical protein
MSDAADGEGTASRESPAALSTWGVCPVRAASWPGTAVQFAGREPRYSSGVGSVGAVAYSLSGVPALPSLWTNPSCHSLSDVTCWWSWYLATQWMCSGVLGRFVWSVIRGSPEARGQANGNQ